MSILISGAPFKVHVVDISALFIAFVIPGLIASTKKAKRPIYIWLVGSIIGLLFWDVFSAYVIVKREIFMGWYFVYPIGVTMLVLLQLLVKYINSKIPYNKPLQGTC